MEKNSLLQKLKGEWVQALIAVISGIVFGGQALLWLVDGIQGNLWPITSNASPPKWAQKSLCRKLAPIPLMVTVVGNKWEICADTRV